MQYLERGSNQACCLLKGFNVDAGACVDFKGAE